MIFVTTRFEHSLTSSAGVVCVGRVEAGVLTTQAPVLIGPAGIGGRGKTRGTKRALVSGASGASGAGVFVGRIEVGGKHVSSAAAGHNVCFLLKGSGIKLHLLSKGCVVGPAEPPEERPSGVASFLAKVYVPKSAGQGFKLEVWFQSTSFLFVIYFVCVTNFDYFLLSTALFRKAFSLCWTAIPHMWRVEWRGYSRR